MIGRLKHFTLSALRCWRHLKSCLVYRKDYPWYSYAASEFLKTIPAKSVVIEFGTGYSAFFWETRDVDYLAIESDKAWYDLIRSKGAWTRSLYYSSNYRTYVSFLSKIDHFLNDKAHYVVVIIDGRWRNECARRVVQWSKADLILLDDANWFDKADKILRKQYPMVVPLVGGSPGVFYQKVTNLYIPQGSKFFRKFSFKMPEFEGTVPANFEVTEET